MAIIGIDVSKNKLDVAWLRDPEANKIKTRVFKNTHTAYPALLDWLTQNTGETTEQIQVAMEATGIYHEPLAYWLHRMGVTVHVLNPLQVHQYAKSYGQRSKTDKKDSVLIARFCHERQPEAWQPEPEEIRELKRLIGRIEMLKEDIQREENRQEKAQFSRDLKSVESTQQVLQALRAEQRRLEQSVNDHLDRHDNLKRDQALLNSIPGIGEVVSLQLMVGLNSRSFQSARQAGAFFGLVPVMKVSGSSVKLQPRLSKAGSSAMRQKLYMAAVTAVQHNPDVRALYQRLIRRGKAKMAALGAAMRKLVHIAYGVLKHQTEYRPQHT